MPASFAIPAIDFNLNTSSLQQKSTPFYLNLHFLFPKSFLINSVSFSWNEPILPIIWKELFLWIKNEHIRPKYIVTIFSYLFISFNFDPNGGNHQRIHFFNLIFTKVGMKYNIKLITKSTNKDVYKFQTFYRLSFYFLKCYHNIWFNINKTNQSIA